MQKEKITLQEVWKENGINFTVMNGGYVDNAPKPLKHQVNHQTDDDELLLPTGFELEDEDEKQKIQRNVTQPEAPMFPLGVEIENSK